jgi:hypothetical protein
LNRIQGTTYWYQPANVDLNTQKTRFDAHTHDGTTNNGPQLAAAGLASNAVTTAKILDANVTDGKIATVSASKVTGTLSQSQLAANSVGTSQIIDGNVTNAKLGTASVTDAKVNDVAFGKITGTVTPSDGTVTNAKIVSMDGSKLIGTVTPSDGTVTNAKIVSMDGSKLTGSLASNIVVTGSITDANVTQAKLSAGVVNQLGQNIGIQNKLNTSTSVSTASGDSGYVNALSITTQGFLYGVGWKETAADYNSTPAVFYIRIILDGTTLLDYSHSLANTNSTFYATINNSIDANSLVKSGGTTLTELSLHFKTSLVIQQRIVGSDKSGQTHTLQTNVVYERAA